MTYHSGCNAWLNNLQYTLFAVHEIDINETVKNSKNKYYQIKKHKSKKISR